MNAKENIVNACIVALSSLVLGQTAHAAEEDNVSTIVAVGKVSANACRVKLQTAAFPNSCPAATNYKEAYFTCNGTEGKEFLAIALTAHANGHTVRMTTNSCSQYGSSVANLSALSIE